MGSASAPLRLLVRLAEGGMADVYVAARGADRELVVVKRIARGSTLGGELIDFLREEARLASQLHHPNVCRMDGAIDGADGVTLVMEYLEGVQLRRLASPTSDLGLIVGLLAQAAAGLDHVHQLSDARGRPLGIVHRDVNPQNLMATVEGIVKLLDFGIAKARDTELRTTTGAIKGTPAYLAPEQVRGDEVDHRADVFALGSTAARLLVGQAPFARDDVFATLLAITSAPLPDFRRLRPELPAAMAHALGRALDRDRTRRFASAGAFAAALADALPPGVAPLAPAAIGERIRAQFALELDDRRRRIALALDAIDGGEATELAAERVTAQTVRLGDVAATAPPSPPRPSRRWLPYALVGAAGVALAALASFAAVRGGHDAPPARGPAGPTAEPVRNGPTAEPVRNGPTAEPVRNGPTAEPVRNGPTAEPVRNGPTAEPVRNGPTAEALVAAEPDAAPPPTPRRKRPDRRAARAEPVVSGPPGFVTIGSTPFATIYLGGKELGVTPLFRKAVPPGRHRLRAVCSCGETRDVKVVVEPGVATAPIKLTW